MNKVKDIFAHTDCVSEEMLLKYIAGKLPPAEKHEVERHLIDCEMCSDAVDGLTVMDSKRISSITSELNQKIQNRVEKKEVKVFFLQQYRTQLAVAASIILVVGLVWFFKTNISMKEMDNAESNKIFAEKFSPPPPEKDEEATTGKEQSEPDAKNPVTAQDPALLVNNATLEEAEKKAVSGGEHSYSANGEAKSGKDLADEKHLGWAENRKYEDVSKQKTEHAQQDISALKGEDKEENNFYRNKNAETTPKGNVTISQSEKLVTPKSEVVTRDEDAVVLGDKIVLSKEQAVSKNQNELESLEKEKNKKDERKKPEPSTVVTATGTTTAVGAYGQPSTDKSAALKQDTKKATDDREKVIENNNMSRPINGEGDVSVSQIGKKAKLESKKDKKGRQDESKKNSSYADIQNSTSTPMPEIRSQTKSTQTESSVKLDTISMSGTFESTVTNADGLISNDSSMIKYNKQDYAGAVADFEETLKQNPNNEKALFYSAVSYLSLEQTEKALSYFNKILSNKNSKYYDDTQWYSSLAYIKNNDMKNARTNLIKIQHNEKSRYKKQADETLEQIKK